MLIQGSPFTCPRGLVLDDGWRKAVSPHPFFIPQRCPETRYCILRYRVDNRPSSFQDVQRYPRDSGRSWREGIRFIFPATYQEHKLADLQKSEITHTVLFVLHFQQNRWMTCFVCYSKLRFFFILCIKTHLELLLLSYSWIYYLYHLQAGKLLQLASAFFGGFVIAFTRGWLLTLVMLTSLPLIAIAGAVSAQFLTKVSSKKLTSYGDAGDTVEQTIGAIRTVCSNYVNYFTVYQLLCR